MTDKTAAPPPSPAAFLRAAGEALYGDRWLGPLARDLDVADRTMRRWAADGPPERVEDEVRALVARRVEALSALLAPPAA